MAAIFLKYAGELVEMTEQPYQAERDLQELLALYPNLLAGHDDDEERTRWVLVQREVGVASEEDAADRWSVDHLFLDDAGVPTLVEVKRSSDTRIRRQVVGQILDYAAHAATHWKPETIRDLFENTHREAGSDPDDVLSVVLGYDGDPEEYWTRVATNLQARRLRLIFVADRIPPELRQVVEFLNEQMASTEVLALEVRQYIDRDGERQTLVPQLIGRTETARQAKTTTSRVYHRWTEEDVIDALRSAWPDELAKRVVELYQFMREQPDSRVSLGSGAEPSAQLWLGESDNEDEANPVAVLFRPASLTINYSFVREDRSPEEMQRLARLAREIPGVADHIRDLEERDYRIRPPMNPEDVLGSDEALQAFKHSIRRAAQRGDGSEG